VLVLANGYGAGQECGDVAAGTMRVLVPPSAEILQKFRRNSEEILQNSFEEILWHPAEGAGDVLCTGTAENLFSAEN